MSDYSFIANNPQSNPVNQLNGIMTLANGMQNYKRGNIELQKSQETMQSDIAQSKALSQTAQEGAQQQHLTTILGHVRNGAQQALSLYGQGKTPDEVRQFVINTMTNAGAKPEAIQQQIADIPNDPAQIDSFLVKKAQSVLSLPDQMNSKFPAPAMVNTGGSINPVAPGNQVLTGVQPGTPQGQNIENTLPVGQRQEVARDQFGNPVVLPRSASGQYGAPKQLPGSSPAPMMSFPAGESADTKAKFENEYHAATTNYQQSGTIHSYNTDLLKAIDASTTGTAGPLIAKAQSIFGNVPGGTEAEKAASAYDMVGKYTERQALLATQAMGMQTNASLEAQIKANGSQNYNPTALKTITKLNDALQTGMDAYTPGLQKAISTSPNQIFAKRQFDMQWGANFKPEVMQLYNAAKTGDKEEVSNIINSVGGKGSKGAQELLNRAHNIQLLSQQGHL
jgi:hypothetical protein